MVVQMMNLSMGRVMELVKSEPKARIDDEVAPALTLDLFHVRQFRQPAWCAW